MFPALFISISTLFPFLKFNCPEHHEYTLRLSTNQLFSYIFMDLYRSNKIELSSLTWSNSLYGDNQIVQFGPCNFLYDLAVLQDLEGRNHPDSQLLCQSLPTVLRWISVSSCICIRELGSGKRLQTLLSWLQSSFRKTTSRYFPDNSWNFGAITLQGPHLKNLSNNMTSGK